MIRLLTLLRVLMVGMIAAGCTSHVVPPPQEKVIEIRGIYGSPNAFWERGYRLDDLGVNAIFMHGPAITEAIMVRARAESLRVFAEFPTLNGKGYVESHPEAWAINEKGDRVEAASWFMGVCPTEPGFRTHRMEELRRLMARFDVDGVWMDYVHWHAQFEEPEPILPETCFCPHCLTTFQAATGIVVPDGPTPEKAQWIFDHHDREWRDWRADVIAGWARDFRRIVKQINPDALVGIYHAPWDDEEYDGARRRILGLDYDLLRETADVFSPMVYHARMGRSPEWVKENIEWFSDRMNINPSEFPKVWTIVQAYDGPRRVTPEEFESVLRNGLAGGATGVQMFTSNAVAEDSLKTAVMAKVYRGE